MRSYTVAIEIALSRARIVELFDDPSGKFKWQAGLHSHEHLSGESGQPGAVSKGFKALCEEGRDVRDSA